MIIVGICRVKKYHPPYWHCKITILLCKIQIFYKKKLQIRSFLIKTIRFFARIMLITYLNCFREIPYTIIAGSVRIVKRRHSPRSAILSSRYYLADEMLDSCYRVVDNHPGARPSHYHSDTLFHLRSIAMHRTFLAGRLVLAITASLKSAMGIIQ